MVTCLQGNNNTPKKFLQFFLKNPLQNNQVGICLYQV